MFDSLPRAARASLALSLLSLVVAAPGLARDEAPSIAVLDLRPASAADEQVASLLSAALVPAVKAAHSGRVIGFSEVRALLNASAQQQLVGCVDERCVADVGGAVAADLLVSGTVGVLDGNVMVFLALIAPQEAAVKARSSHVFREKADAAKEAALAVKRLLDPDAARQGDQILADLRTAIVFDEADAEGKSLRARPVGTCVQQQLLDGGATLVSPQQIARIKKQLDPRALLDGSAPEDALTTADADLLVVGLVDYAENGESKLVKSYRADLALQVIKIDTGEIVAAETLSGVHPGHSIAMAQRAAGQQLCAKVKPALEKGLERKFARGSRIVVEAKGALAAGGAEELKRQLQAADRSITRVAVRRFAQDDATLDVTVAGGDGVKLALLLSRGGAPVKVLEAGPSKLVLAPR